MDEEIKSLKQDIQRAKSSWVVSNNHAEAQRLQDLIAERRKVQVNHARLERARVLRRAKLCRKFYARRFAGDRHDFEEQCRLTADRAQSLKRERRAARRHVRELAEFELGTANAELRQAVKQTKASQGVKWREEMMAHMAKVSRQQLEHRQVLTESMHVAHTTDEKMRRLSSSVHETMEEQRREEDRIALAICSEKERALDARRLELALRRATEQSSQRTRWAHVRKHAAQRRSTRALERSLQQVTWEEELRRQRLTQLWRIAFAELVRRTMKWWDESHVRAAKSPSDHQSAASGQRCESESPLPFSREPRSTKLAEIVALRQTQAKASRAERLRRVLSHVESESARATALRLKMLERRRGEKVATECEPFVVQRGLSTVPELLPESARAPVLDLIRHSSFE